MTARIQSAVGGYTHVQDTPATDWVIPHNIGTDAPIVDCFIDVDGVTTKIIPSDVTVTDQATVTVTFSSVQSGTAYVA